MKCGLLLARLFCRAFLAICTSVIAIFYLLPAYPAAAQSQSTAYIRVIHASPFVGTADVFVDGKEFLSSFQFAAVTDYVPLPAGPHLVQVALMGKGINAAVITQTLPVTAGYTYTVAALGTQPDALSLHVFVDNNLVRPQQAKVRVYYLAPDAGNASANLGGYASFNNIAYPSASNYVSENVGPCTFSFNDPQHSSVAPLSMSLRPNTVTSIFAVGLFNGDPKAQLVEANSPGIPGLPSTGSEPVVIDHAIEQPFIPWILLGVLLALFSASVVLRVKRAAR